MEPQATSTIDDDRRARPAMGIVAAGSAASTILAVLGWTLAISLAAQVRIPVPGTEVPMTLQPLAVLLTGMFLCPTRAVAATLLYLGCGAAGLPVFAPHSAGLVGPTAGYLVGFVAAAWLIAILRGPGRASYMRLILAGAVGMAVVFAFGIAWRLPMLGGDAALAIRTGLLPFLAKTAVEVLLASGLVYGVRRAGPAHGGVVSRDGVPN